MPDSAVCPVPKAISHDNARAMEKKLRREMPGLTSAAYRREAARRMGTDYDTYLTAWKKPAISKYTNTFVGDTPVPASAGKVLDKWVQLRGSGTITSNERKVLSSAIDSHGQVMPTVYRGATEEGITLPQARAKYAVGNKVNFNVVSTSSDRFSALPYAENGEGVGILFNISRHAEARGLSVSGRSEAVAGYAEEEWITKGNYRIISSVMHDDILWVILR